MTRKRPRVYTASIKSKRRLHLDQQHPPPIQEDADETDVFASFENDVPKALEKRPSPVVATVYFVVKEQICSEPDQANARRAMVAINVHLVERFDEMKATEVPRTKREATSFFKNLLITAALAYAKDGLEAVSAILKKILNTFDGD